MILLGVPAGSLLARWQKCSWTFPPLRVAWLVILAFLPQLFAFNLPVTRTLILARWVAVGLITSQLLLLAFGLTLNLLVIVANGGFMPNSPQTASRLVPQEVL